MDQDAVNFAGKQFDKAIMSCSPLRPQDYDDARKTIWNKIVAEHGPPMQYPDSIAGTCEVCGVSVQIGPRQQEQMKKFEVTVCCPIDTVAVMTASGHTPADVEANVVSLDNPYGSRT